MLFFNRAATIAAVSLTILALASPGKAWDNRTPVSTPALSTTTSAINVPDTVPVPDSMVPAATTSTPDEVNLAGAPAPSVGLTFASLSAAVAAQDVPGEIDSELACLAGAVYFESKGEPLSGQLAVADVILNRTTSGRFPKSICGVVKQPGQFSFVRGGAIPTIKPGPQYRTAMAIAKVAMKDQWNSPAPKALYFHARYVSPGWARPRVAMIGNHIFYR
jgi:spore germination cell wall hydrolase CwlJ-like protein